MYWTVVKKGAPVIHCVASASIGNCIYCFGGIKEFNECGGLISVIILNTITLTFKNLVYEVEVDDVPSDRFAFTAVAYGRKIYIWGGKDHSTYYDTLHCFDTDTLKWSTPRTSGTTPDARVGHSACVVKNKMYIFGGHLSEYECTTNDVHYLELDTMKWVVVLADGAYMTPRSGHTAVAVGDRMYVFGGCLTYNKILANYFDTVKDIWVDVPCDVKVGNPNGHSAWVYNDCVFIFGGSKNEIVSNELWCYSIKDSTWQLTDVAGRAPGQIMCQTCVLNGDKVYLFGGNSLGRITMAPNTNLHVLEYSPSLKTISIMTVLKYDLDRTCLPNSILDEIHYMTVPRLEKIRSLSNYNNNNCSI